MADDLCTRARTVDQKLGLEGILTFTSDDSTKNQCAVIIRKEQTIHAEMIDKAGCKRIVDVDSDRKVKVKHELKPADGQKCDIPVKDPKTKKVTPAAWRSANDYLDSQEKCGEGETCYLPPEQKEPLVSRASEATALFTRLFSSVSSFFQKS